MKNFLRTMLNCSLIMISLLLYTHFFSFLLWEKTRGPILIWVFLFVCTVPALFFFGKLKEKDVNKRIVIWLLIVPIIAGFLKSIFSPQPLISERTSILLFFATMQYFLIKGMKVTEKQIIIVFTIFGLVTLALQIYQQIPGNIPVFGIIGNDEENIGKHQRNDIYRFYIGSIFLGLFCLYYWWTSIMKRITPFRVIIFVCFIASIYLYITKQVMAICLVVIMLSVFMINNKKMRRVGFILFALLAVFLVVYYDVLFKTMIDEYADDTSSTDTRWVEIVFFLGHIFSDPIRALFGHGRDLIIEQQGWDKELYTNDVGFIGESFYYGIVWTVIFFATCYKYIIKFRKKIPLYIWLFFVGITLDSLFVFPYRTNPEMFIWVCIIYIGHLHVDNKDGRYNELIIYDI